MTAALQGFAAAARISASVCGAVVSVCVCVIIWRVRVVSGRVLCEAVGDCGGTAVRTC